MRKVYIVLLFSLLYVTTLSIPYLNEKTGVGFGIGSGGYEVKGLYKFNNYFSSSLEFNSMGLENISVSDDSNGDIDVAGTIKVSSVKGLLHLHPFASGFRISAGYTYNLSDIEIELEGTDVVLDEENPDTTTSDLTGTITINTGEYMPYIGIGWGYAYEDFLNLDFALGIQFIPKIVGEDLLTYDITMDATALDGFIDTVITDLADTNSEAYQSVVDAGYDPAEVQTALSSAAVQAAIATGDPFELYETLEAEGILEQFGIDPDDDSSASIARASNGSSSTFSSLPNPDDYIGAIQTQIDEIVEESGLKAVQDVLGYAPLPVFSFGFTLFFF